ncbi:stage VI sporulation protein D [Bacillus sp. 2205SS5-2]|uniref:stage VI sporulation protein D n=1 Tax=Bacillus sp. 2205SS5-2 TaxID=3109031 RepID=UPI0030078A5E
MTQGQPSCLRFSLEESIWFKRGQEVEELRSISLDPHITIQEQEQYVLIRGHLELTGEYIGGELEEENVQEDWSEEKKYGKLVSKVERDSEGECAFSHSFPVDITIPKNRISNLDSIDVFVDSFDYIVPENACLKLTADLTIMGIESESQEEAIDISGERVLEPLARTAALEEAIEIQIEDTPQAELPSNEEYEPFYLEAKKERVQDDDVPVEVKNQKKDSPPVFHYEEEQRKQDSPFEHMFSVPDTDESSSSSSSSSSDANYLEEESSSSQMEFEESEEESSVVQPVKKAKNKKDKYESISLTDFFARKDEDIPAKLKVCIVQEGDTIDGLAEKYETSVQNLLRVNQLDVTKDVYEGQVLYIPYTPAYK